MSEYEVVVRLKDHLLYCIRDHGTIKSTDKQYCIRYIMDFLFVCRTQAKQFYEQNIE